MVIVENERILRLAQPFPFSFSLRVCLAGNRFTQRRGRSEGWGKSFCFFPSKHAALFFDCREDHGRLFHIFSLLFPLTFFPGWEPQGLGKREEGFFFFFFSFS